MAAEIPQEKSIELLRTYGDMLKLGMSINDMDYMRSSKELSSGDQHSANTISAQGLLYALHGNIKKSNEYFDSHMNAADNPHSVAVNYCFMLQETKQFELFLKRHMSLPIDLSQNDLAIWHIHLLIDMEILITSRSIWTCTLSRCQTRKVDVWQKNTKMS